VEKENVREGRMSKVKRGRFGKKAVKKRKRQLREEKKKKR